MALGQQRDLKSKSGKVEGGPGGRSKSPFGDEGGMPARKLVRAGLECVAGESVCLSWAEKKTSRTSPGQCLIRCGTYLESGEGDKRSGLIFVLFSEILQDIVPLGTCHHGNFEGC